MERGGLGSIELYNIPHVCEMCGGVMIFKGVGEYQCEDCQYVDYDDYGKVRLYIEEHRGATAAQIEEAVGVSQRAIRRMLKEGRIEVAESSKTFLRCEICGKTIRSGQYCPECEVKVHRKLEEEERERRHKQDQGFGMEQKAAEGQKRFKREN
ncbi:MAG: hypothetical protein HFH82_00440 [Lachnospiraceae bacterium]|nr:hypothetical protein [Lachnospiraceae bacterium]